MKSLHLAALILLAAGPAVAQPPPHGDPPADAPPFDPAGRFAVYTAAGARADLDAVVAAMAEADVVFLGEIHNDPTAHALQRVLLEAAHRRYGAARPVALSLEMVERDAQLVLDEYLAGLIRERDFLAASRPWGNYRTDYRPLVEYAKAHGLPVVAANAPGRYVSRVGREGVAGLGALDAEALRLLPTLPVAPPSEAYAAKFVERMSTMGGPHGAAAPDDSTHASVGGAASPHGTAMPTLDTFLAAQNLRDAAMGHALAGHLARHPGALVVHVNGAFHSEGGLGVPEQLAHYAPAARVLVVTFDPADDLDKAPDPSDDDFLVLTDRAAIPER
jgi:uncharacterized iron-regulated protein